MDLFSKMYKMRLKQDVLCKNFYIMQKVKSKNFENLFKAVVTNNINFFELHILTYFDLVCYVILLLLLFFLISELISLF